MADTIRARGQEPWDLGHRQSAIGDTPGHGPWAMGHTVEAACATELLALVFTRRLAALIRFPVHTRDAPSWDVCGAIDRDRVSRGRAAEPSWRFANLICVLINKSYVRIIETRGIRKLRSGRRHTRYPLSDEDSVEQNDGGEEMGSLPHD